MLIRYSSRAGTIKKKAHIYTRDEHGIVRGDIDRDALSILDRLDRAGYGAYVVGGALRDLIVGERPNDFDIATDARPQAIKKLFRRARIIGRRFRLVHVYAGSNKIFEVSTFRSGDPEDANSFGTMDEDVFRRDFTVNALYFDATKEYLIDYVGGFDDLRAGRLSTVQPALESFAEDPVRMIRAVKYAVGARLTIPDDVGAAINRRSALLDDCSPERLTEEMNKLLSLRATGAVLRGLADHGLLAKLLPRVTGALGDALGGALSHMNGDGSRADKLEALLAGCINGGQFKSREDPNEEAASALKDLFRPLVLPNVDARLVASRITGAEPRKRRRRPRGRRASPNPNRGR